MGGDVVERVEVVDVGRQQRDLDRRSVRCAGQQRRQRVALGFGEVTQLGEVAPQRRLVVPRLALGGPRAAAPRRR